MSGPCFKPGQWVRHRGANFNARVVCIVHGRVMVESPDWPGVAWEFRAGDLLPS